MHLHLQRNSECYREKKNIELENSGTASLELETN